MMLSYPGLKEYDQHWSDEGEDVTGWKECDQSEIWGKKECDQSETRGRKVCDQSETQR